MRKGLFLFDCSLMKSMAKSVKICVVFWFLNSLCVLLCCRGPSAASMP